MVSRVLNCLIICSSWETADQWLNILSHVQMVHIICCPHAVDHPFGECCGKRSTITYRPRCPKTFHKSCYKHALVDVQYAKVVYGLTSEQPRGGKVRVVFAVDSVGFDGDENPKADVNEEDNT